MSKVMKTQDRDSIPYWMWKNYKIQLSSKKLKSGKCQVKFKADLSIRKSLYGYLLVEASATLKDVVQFIGSRLELMHDRDSAQHIKLYQVGNQHGGPEMIIFDN